MNPRSRNTLWNVLLGAGLYMLDPIRDRMASRMDDLSDRARDTYDTASERLGRASDAIRGNDSPMMSKAGAMLLGIGIGVGIGLLVAPASGEETRSNLSDKAQEFGDKVRTRFNREKDPATGTYGV
jgi:hypothetical protein